MNASKMALLASVETTEAPAQRLRRTGLPLWLVFTGVVALAWSAVVAAQPHEVWYPSVRQVGTIYQAWLANPRSGQEVKLAGSHETLELATERAVTAAAAKNGGFVPTEHVDAGPPAGVQTTCRTTTALLCALCGAESTRCRSSRSVQDVGYYQDAYGHDACARAAASLSTARKSPTEWARRKTLMCKVPTPAAEPTSDDCAIASDILCEACGATSKACGAIRRWVGAAKLSREHCFQSRQAMEMSQASMNRLPAAQRSAKYREMCESTARELGAMGHK